MRQLVRVSLGDNNNTQLFTRLPKSEHKALKKKYLNHINTVVNYTGSFNIETNDFTVRLNGKPLSIIS